MNETFGVAERQHGSLTRVQLTELGFSASQIQRRVSAGALARVLPNVFRVVGSVPTLTQRRLAACLWVGPTAVLSHAGAGTLMRLEGIATDEIHVTVPANERRRGHGIIVHGSVVPRHDLRSVDSVPWTSAARTLIDCALSLDDETLEAAFSFSLPRPSRETTSYAARPRELAAREEGRMSARADVGTRRRGWMSAPPPTDRRAERISATRPGGPNVASNSTASSITAGGWHGSVIASASPRSRRWVGVWFT